VKYGRRFIKLESVKLESVKLESVKLESVKLESVILSAAKNLCLPHERFFAALRMT